MKVKDLIKLLETANPNANVVMAIQPNWPLEYSVSGVAKRIDCDEVELHDHQSMNDVVLCVGAQLGYGDRSVWDVAQK